MHPPPRWFPLVRQLVQRALASAESSGFRVSNDLAIAIAHLRAAANLTRFAVADLDVHQGDGTAHMIAHDPNAFEFQPEFDFYQSGVDGLKADTPGKSDLTIEGLAARDHRASSSARKHGAPLVITIGGGYADPIELTAAAHAKTYRLAAELAS